jgi:hypothetical protein
VGDFADARRLHAELVRDIKPGSAWLKSVSKDIEREADRIAARVASGDLGGDPKFSGWSPRLDTKTIITRDAVIVSPTKLSAGPWSVAEDGRNQGNAPGFAGPGMTRTGGTVARTKSGGVRRTRARGARRWNGRTRGKNTATQASEALIRAVRPMIDKAWAEQLQKRNK